MKRTMAQSNVDPVATRTLRDQRGRALEVVVHRPVPDTSDPNADWSCRVELRSGKRVKKSFAAHGVDSLQALLLALTGLRSVIGQEKGLTWLGDPGDVGLPLMIHGQQPEFLTLIDHLVQAEHCRHALTWKQLEPAKRRRKR